MPASSEIEAAISAFQEGDLHLAERFCKSRLKSDPFDANALDVLGLILHRKGDSEGALNNIRNAVCLDDQQAQFHSHLGIILKQIGKLEEAKKAYLTAISIEPKSPEVIFNLAILCRQMGDLDEGLILSKKAVSLDPDSDVAHNNLGKAYQEVGLFEDAITAYRQAITLNQEHIGAHSNLATVLAEADRVDQALELCDKAISKWPDNAELHNARSNAYARARNWEEALVSANQAIACKSNFAQAHYGKALILMGLGSLEDGLKEFEWRTKRSNFWPQRQYEQPLWQGEPLAGKTLFVHWEQGFGDIIQFSRFLPLLRHTLLEPPDWVIFDCPANLLQFFTFGFEVDELGDFGNSPPGFDYYVPLMSLPLRLGTTIETIPVQVPYLTNMLDKYFQISHSNDDHLKVGIVWASDHGTTYRRKVCSLEHLSTLFDLEGITFYGLQFGPDAEELNEYIDRGKVKNLAPHLGDFVHTAAIADQMDLIISIDTYIVHLAGAMCKPVWIMLPYAPDWRWFLDRLDSPWYPTARLFRQPRPGDWPSLVSELQTALIQYLADN